MNNLKHLSSAIGITLAVLAIWCSGCSHEPSVTKAQVTSPQTAEGVDAGVLR